MTVRVIAIDGPAASGKSSTASAVARVIGAHHLDSGALYRGLTAVALDARTDDPTRIVAAADRRGLGLVRDGIEIVPVLDGRPAEPLIRSDAVTAHVSAIAALEPLRDWVNRRLRAVAADGHLLVLDGRDIGTAVFPEAPLKIYLTATPEARADRRLRQRGADPDAQTIRQEADALAARDALDAGRAVAPLRQAADAMLLDTTSLAFEDQVARIVAAARAALGASCT
ncbi:MAG: (d)CMP kinase [Gemmatimonadales bacterium]|nr:(d)CMP kinase [Gemmatimonadales bacterium]